MTRADRRNVGRPSARTRLVPYGAVLAAAVATLLVVVAPGGWTRVAVAVGLAVLGAAFAPYWLLAGSRQPTDAERAAVAPALEAPVAVRLRVTDDSAWVGNAVAAGILPGQRYVFVAADLFETLDDSACTAVVAHEVAHHARRHVLVRHAVAVVALGSVVALAEFAPWRLAGAVAVGTVPYLLATAWIVRRTELAADDVAARATSPDALADALETLVEAGLVLGGGTRAGRMFAEHPPVDSRIARLRAAGRRL